MAIFGRRRKSDEEMNARLLESSGLESATALSRSEAADINGEELAAAIMGALMCYFDTHTSGGLRIRSIRRIGRNTPVWNTSGRDEYLASKL